jgi:hypothetical protein
MDLLVDCLVSRSNQGEFEVGKDDTTELPVADWWRQETFTSRHRLLLEVERCWRQT